MEMKHESHALIDHHDKLAMAGHRWLVTGILTDGVIDSLQKLLRNGRLCDRMSTSHNPYGDSRLRADPGGAGQGSFNGRSVMDYQTICLAGPTSTGLSTAAALASRCK